LLVPLVEEAHGGVLQQHDDLAVNDFSVSDRKKLSHFPEYYR
jgi:hypothetical protein